MDRFPIPADQRLLFRSTPPFDLPFRAESLVAIGKVLRPDEADRSSLLGVAFDQSGLMSADAGFKIIRMADVIAAVGAAQHVGPEAHSSLSCPGAGAAS